MIYYAVESVNTRKIVSRHLSLKIAAERIEKAHAWGQWEVCRCNSKGETTSLTPTEQEKVRRILYPALYEKVEVES